MKSFKDYLTESKRSFVFRVKLACECTADMEKALKTLLEKYQIIDFRKSGKTPVQALPLDFPKLRNTEVSIFEVSLAYPVTSFDLHSYIATGMKLHEQTVIVRNPSEPQEEYQAEKEKREGSLLKDGEYKEHKNVDAKDYFGDEYNKSFVQALNNDLKEKRKARGEVIPSEGNAQTTNDLPQNNRSPIAAR